MSDNKTMFPNLLPKISDQKISLCRGCKIFLNEFAMAFARCHCTLLPISDGKYKCPCIDCLVKSMCNKHTDCEELSRYAVIIPEAYRKALKEITNYVLETEYDWDHNSGTLSLKEGRYNI